MNIALFGTSADPPTTGHKAILHWLLSHFDYVAVWAADNPFKAHQASLQHRSMMLQLLIDEIRGQQWGAKSQRENSGEPYISYLPHTPHPTPHTVPIALHPELSSPRTLITVERARALWTNATFTVVVGSDLVSQLPRWYKIKDLLQQVKLLVVPRPGYSLDEDDLDKLRQIGAIVTVANLIPPETSSTAYRQWGVSEAVTSTVDTYIHHHHLYQHAWQDAAPKVSPATMSCHQRH